MLSIDAFEVWLDKKIKTVQEEIGNYRPGMHPGLDHKPTELHARLGTLLETKQAMIHCSLLTEETNDGN